MPLWIYNNHPDEVNEAELLVAQILNHVLVNEDDSDEWLIRWGYWFNEERGDAREGDFLILSPWGELLVLEVKSDLPLAATYPNLVTRKGGVYSQLSDQHRGVITKLKSKLRHVPYIAKAVAVPYLEIDPSEPEFHGVPRRHLLDKIQLCKLLQSWRNLFKPGDYAKQEMRQAFLELFGNHIQPSKILATTKHFDKLSYQKMAADYSILTMLEGNQQWVIEGGVGTGKTWYALETAKRWAQNDSGDRGQEVLLLGYNLNFVEKLRWDAEYVQKPHRGRLIVLSMQQLAEQILKCCNQSCVIPENREDYETYFTVTLPKQLLQCIQTSPQKLPKFDALVVDECQDHDSVLSEVPDLPHGWWSIYVSLLRKGWSSRMAVFGDPAQRPPFRDAQQFKLLTLRSQMSQHVHVRLLTSLRYSQPIYDFLLSLRGEGSDLLVQGLRSRNNLAPGVMVHQESLDPTQIKARFEALIQEWIQRGYCNALDILVLYDRSSIEHSVIAGLQQVYQFRFEPYAQAIHYKYHEVMRHSSINKAKGLDSFAVIMVGVKPFHQLQTAYERYTYFMGASRAQQLLAVLHVEGD